MTNEELIQLVQDRLPEELSLDEIELLRARLGESPELRQALVGHLHFEELLTGAHSRHQVSVETILAHSRPDTAAPSNGRPHAWRWAVAGWLVAIFSTGGVWAWRELERRGDQPPELAQETTPGTGSAASPAGQGGSPTAAGSQSAPGARSESKASAGSPQTAPPDPWATPSDPPRRPFLETCFDEVVLPATDADLDQLKTAWQVVKGNTAPLLKPNVNPTRGRVGPMLAGLTMTGQFKLRTPWPAGHVWRLAMVDAESVRWHFWHGLDGVTLQYVDRPQPSWFAYRARRGQDDFDPQDSILAAGDEDRFRRAEKGTFELRWQDGQLLLTRGDVLLLSVPLSGHPDTVSLEALPRPVVLAGMTIFPGERFPWGDTVLGDTVLGDKAPAAAPQSVAEQPLAKRAWATELPQGAKFNTLPDDRVELAVRDNAKPAWVTLPIGPNQLQQIVFQIAEADAGTGLFVTTDEGRPVVGVGLMASRVQRGKVLDQDLVWGYSQPTDRPIEAKVKGDRQQQPQPLAGPGQWVRFVLAAGAAKIWLSDDGRSWGRALDPRPIDGPATRIGVYCSAGKGPRRISLRRLELRPLTRLATLADQAPRAALDQCAAKAAAAPEIGGWLETVLQQQPAGMSTVAWCEACAVRTLALAPRGELARSLAWSLAEGLAGTGDLPLETRLPMLAEWALLANTMDRPSSEQFVASYESIAEDWFAAGKPRPFSQVRRSYLQAPFWNTINPAARPSRLVRDEILELMFAGDWDNLAQFCRQFRFYWKPAVQTTEERNGEWSETLALIDWAEALALRNRPQQAGVVPSRPVLAAWRHPLVEQLGKEGYNVMAELQAALEGGAYKDACQVIASVTAEQALGLLPTSRDSALLVSLPGAVALAMQDHPPLRRMMQDEFGPLGQLRLRQAIAVGDAAEVQALATRFYGTVAAADAHLWLGDRALAQGDFVRADGQYQAALGDAAVSDHPQIAARLRLAAAMLGRDLGEPVSEPIVLGEKTIPPEAFEKMVAAMRARRGEPGAGRADSGSDGAQQSAAVPEADAYRLRPVAKLKLPSGRDSRIRRDQDWIACQLGTAQAGDLTLVSSRTELTALNREGTQAWSLAVDTPGRGNQWPLVAMQPRVADPAEAKSRIYVRRLLEAGPELACIQGGQLVWRSPRGEVVASDPLLAADQLVAVMLSTAQQEMLQLSLASFDAASGKVLWQRPLAQFRDVWQRELACQLAQVGDTLVVVGGGAVIGCSLEGEPRWLRRETWLAGVIDPRASGQRYDAPLARGKLVYVAQPGVPSVACLNVRTGRLQWQQPLSDVVQMLGLADDKLIVQTTEGFVAFDAESGKHGWRLDAPQPIVAQLDASADTLFFAQRVPFINKQSQVQLTWVDARSGSPSATSTLAGWSTDQPALGPLVAHDGRTWVLAGPQVNDPVRELFAFESVGSADTSDPQTRAIMAWAGPAGGSIQGKSVALGGGWQLLSNEANVKAGWQANQNGESDVFLTTATVDRPARWLRHVELPADRPTRLRARVAAMGKEPWKLVIAAGDAVLVERTIEPGPWQTVDVDLSALAGRSVWLVARQEIRAGRMNAAWKSLELSTALDQ